MHNYRWNGTVKGNPDPRGTADRHGAATYQRDLSNGQRIITFVLGA